MKKILLLLLVSANCLGNTYVKETGFRKILCFFCPCARKKTSYAPKPHIKRVKSFYGLSLEGNTPVPETWVAEDYLHIFYGIKKGSN